MSSNWFFVIQSPTGVTIASKLGNRECAYMSQSYSDCVLFAKRLRTSLGSYAYQETFRAVNKRGGATTCKETGKPLRSDAFTLPTITRSTDHIPSRRV